uniref:Uncharacterized protein n=1 Tax=Bos indicus x Bos taurus TaxID=30522 RepID=A0A4W2CE08_BOBOX
MGKSCKVVVCGQASVGKTSILEQLLYGNHVVGSEMIETQEDIYVGSIETDRGVREQVRFYDTRGLRDGAELPRHCFSCTDGYVLVYSTDSRESFQRVELLKKEIDKSKDKKEVCRGTPVVRDSGPWAGFRRPGTALFFPHLPGARFETGGQGWRPLPGIFTTGGAHMLRQLNQRGYSSLGDP